MYIDFNVLHMCLKAGFEGSVWPDASSSYFWCKFVQKARLSLATIDLFCSTSRWRRRRATVSAQIKT